ncbi:uridine kinase family protein [Streptomyces aidingensis]|uniref:Uridine kinase n=1 Tax=Streptomyces aidingensis TaxID=910347 RepID=A0A1I1MXJ0_9ACTN|nr:hypothetical protein [Streptomyces aidingensis]SFC90069.1 Uridine kinase [Streptomyces aidingensis]
MTTADDPALTGLAARLRGLRPSLGPVRLIGVDGHAGSGKTTLSAALSRALGGAPVVHLDDLACHASLFGWTGRLDRQVLRPLGRGEPAPYQVYDWERRGYIHSSVVKPAPVVLLEGVGAGRRAVRPFLACLIWLRVDRETAWARGQRRDGAALDPFWASWKRAELRHLAEDPSAPFADILLEPHGGTFRILERQTRGPAPGG